MADEEPQVAERVLACALVSTPLALQSFAPDGGWAEGPMYWNYATRYTVFMMASLDSALGTSFGFEGAEGFSKTGFFRIYSQRPTGKTFNFADGEPDIAPAWQMFWLSRRFQEPVFGGDELRVAEQATGIFHLLNYPLNHVLPADASLPLNKLFEGVNVAFLRKSWNDPRAIFIGFKGGDNKANHSHLDLGTFVLDALGARWAIDLGPDNYNLPGCFGNDRWNYYRLRTEAHNTITIDRDNQSTTARARIINFSADPDCAYAIADLSEAYQGLKSAKRGIALLGKKLVLVQDDLEAPQARSIVWHLHTPAVVTVRRNGTQAILSQKGNEGEVKLAAGILEPKNARFVPEPVKVPPIQAPQPDVTDLTIPVKMPAGRCRIVVTLSAEPGSRPPIKPLEQWGRLIFRKASDR